MRIARTKTGLLLIVALLVAAMFAPAARGQHVEYMDPEESAAKARVVLLQLITANGGTAIPAIENFDVRRPACAVRT